MALPITSANRVADWFLANVDRASGDSITHLKLQKLVYYAQAWSLANFNKPLFAEDFQAWAHGPVAPSIWTRYKGVQAESLPPAGAPPNLTREQDAVLPEVLKIYGCYEAKFLENMTHNEDPWKTARGDLPRLARCTSIIPKRVMRDYYGEKIGKKWPQYVLSS
jgi:uncharacterized phage-associated protein